MQWFSFERPAWFRAFTHEQQQQYEAECDAMKATELKLRAARVDEAGVACGTCHRASGPVDRDERCAFCQLSRFLYLASGRDIARFVHGGALAL